MTQYDVATAKGTATIPAPMFQVMRRTQGSRLRKSLVRVNATRFTFEVRGGEPKLVRGRNTERPTGSPSRAYESLDRPQVELLRLMREYKPKPEPTPENWIVVGPPKGTFGTHPWDRVTPRCQHDVEITNQKSAPKSSICEACCLELVSKGPQYMPPTIKTIPDTTTPTLIRREKDKPWRGTPSVLKCAVRPQVVTPKPEMQRPTGRVELVSPTLRTIPANTIHHYHEETSGEWPYAFGKFPNVTPGVAIDDALNATFTTTSINRNYGSENYTDDGDKIEQADMSMTSATASPVLDPEQDIQKRVEDERGREVVVLSKHGAPARSYFDGYRVNMSPDHLSMLQPNLQSDAMFEWAVIGCMASFPPNESTNGNYNARLAAMIRSHAHEFKPLVGEGCFTSDFVTKQVRERLAGITPDRVRRLRELWAELGIFPESSIT